MRLLLSLLAVLTLCGCLTTAQYARDKAVVRDLGEGWQDMQDRAACTRGGVIAGSLEYTKCRLDLNQQRLVKAQAAAKKDAAAKAEADKAAAKKP